MLTSTISWAFSYLTSGWAMKTAGRLRFGAGLQNANIVLRSSTRVIASTLAIGRFPTIPCEGLTPATKFMKQSEIGARSSLG